MSTFPATNSNEAVELIIDGGNQLHQIINEDATTEVQTESGPIPSVRKALADTFLFLDPIPWQQGSDETAFNQLRTFNGDIYWAPTATLSTPIPMGATPIGDSNWKLAPARLDKSSILTGLGRTNKGFWDENPYLESKNDFVVERNTRNVFSAISYPYQVDSSAHPDPNSLIGTELVDAGDFATSNQIDEIKSETSKNTSDIENLNYARFLRASDASQKLIDGESQVWECYGDSTMWGAIPGNTTQQDPYNSPKSLSDAANLIWGGRVTVENKAISGTTLDKLIKGTDGGIGTFEERISSSLSQIIYCNHCLNDCNARDGGVYQNSVEDYQENLIKFVSICRNYGKIPVIVTPSMISPVVAGQEYQMKRISSFVETQRNVASAMSVDLVDNNLYSVRSSRFFKPRDIVGDGIHLTQRFYKQAGYNMLIPLVNPIPLSKHGDIAGLSDSVWNDTITNARAIFELTDSDFSCTLSGDNTNISQQVFYPTLLEYPTDDTFLSVGSQKSGAGGEASLSYMGDSSDPVFSGPIDYNRSNFTNQNAYTAPTFCKLPAGLHIVGINSPAIGDSKNFNFAGVRLVSKYKTVGDNPVPYGFDSIVMGGCDITFISHVSSSDDIYISLNDIEDNSEVKISLKKVGSDVVLSCDGVDTTVISNVNFGAISTTLTIGTDGGVTARFGGVTVSSSVTLTTVYISTQQLYTLRYFK